MAEEQSATTGAGGKKARRGRRQDDTLPPSRSRDVQRAFRARRAAHLTHLEASVDWLVAENAALRQRCGLPLDGPPLTGAPPVEEVIEGPNEAQPATSAKKAARAKPRGKNAKAAAPSGDDHSDAEGKMDEEDSPIPQDEARGAAEVLAGGPANPNNGSMSLPPMNVPSASTSAPPHSAAAPHAPYSLSQQQMSPRLQQPNGFQHHPSQIPYLVNHPHASVGYPSQPLNAYAPQQYPNPYQPFQGNPGVPYNSYYPHAPAHAQYNGQQPHPNGNPSPHMPGPFSMTLPPPNAHVQPYPSQHPPSLTTSQRNSVSSAASPQSATPPSSHLRAPTFPTPAPPGPHHHSPHAQPHVYPALIPSPSSVLAKSPHDPPVDSYPPKPLHHNARLEVDLRTQLEQQQQRQQQQHQAMFDSIFPTPSPEDEQFFLDTFCGLANSTIMTNSEDLFLQSLFPNPNSNQSPNDGATITIEGDKDEERGSAGAREREIEARKETAIRGGGGGPGGRIDATRYKSFCVGLMKGVKGIEGLIAQKRKRDREARGEYGGGGSQGGRRDDDDDDDHDHAAKKRRCGETGASSPEERREKEDEAVAFLAEAAAMASSIGDRRDKDCCGGIIDCGPPTNVETKGGAKGVKTERDDCCGGLIDCGDTDNGPHATHTGETPEEDDGQKVKKGEECCSGLISCEDGSKASRPLAQDTTSLSEQKQADMVSPPLTIYLPRLSSFSPNPKRTTSSPDRGPETVSGDPSATDETDAYILVSLAFAELSQYMSPSPNSSPHSSSSRPSSPSAFLSPTRVAELLYNDNPTISSTLSSSSSSSVDPAPLTAERSASPNLIIVPPTKEAEERGKKGELYVRKHVVQVVKKWCQDELARYARPE